MRLELVHPFVEASYELIRGYWPDGLHKSDISLLDRETPIEGLSIVVGIKDHPGDRIIVNMGDPTGLSIAGRLMEEKIAAWDDVSRSALGEFANMLCGLSVTKMEREGLLFDIEPPQIHWHQGGKGMRLEQESLFLLLETAVGQIRIIVSMDTP